VVAGVLAGVLALFFSIAIWLGWVQWQHYDAVLETVTPRIARMQGIAIAHQDIREVLTTTRAILSDYAYPAEVESARVASDFQGRVRDAFQAAGLNIVGSQLLPARPNAGFDEIGLSLSLQGGLPQLQRGLTALQAIVPRVRVEQIRLQPLATRQAQAQSQSPAQQLNVQTRLIVFRIRAS
jgi:general secretion pathway protein M